MLTECCRIWSLSGNCIWANISWIAKILNISSPNYPGALCSTHFIVRVEVIVTFLELDSELGSRLEPNCQKARGLYSVVKESLMLGLLWGSSAYDKVRTVKGSSTVWRLGGGVMKFASGRKWNLRWILKDEWAFFDCWSGFGPGDGWFLWNRESLRAGNFDHRLYIYTYILFFL